MTNASQMSFADMLSDAETDNRQRRQDRAWDHLPGNLKEAIPYLRWIITEHHNAMMCMDFETAIAWREEACMLASKLNGGRGGIIADDAAPGCVLDAATRATDGTIPLWGQSGRFTLEVGGMACDVEMNGLFGIGATSMQWLGFSVRAIDWTKPFLSQTGYRSFLGVHLETDEPLNVHDYTHAMLSTDLAEERCKGRGPVIPKRPTDCIG